MGTVLLYGLSADDTDKREQADNRQDEEVLEVEGFSRVEGRGDIDLLRIANLSDIFYEK